MEAQKHLKTALEGLERWDGDSITAIAPAVASLEWIAVEADVIDEALPKNEGAQRWLRLSAAGAIALAQVIEAAELAEEHGQPRQDIDRIGARLREAVALVTHHAAVWLRAS